MHGRGRGILGQIAGQRTLPPKIRFNNLLLVTATIKRTSRPPQGIRPLSSRATRLGRSAPLHRCGLPICLHGRRLRRPGQRGGAALIPCPGSAVSKAALSPHTRQHWEGMCSRAHGNDAVAKRTAVPGQGIRTRKPRGGKNLRGLEPGVRLTCDAPVHAAVNHCHASHRPPAGQGTQRGHRIVFPS
jgi:hypothetical protein